ncbi:MAG TPA: helicase C-terminal domain-containing protein [Desulfobacteria bacterium]|nr:helicase C-terminal domain-containing protein [Desulfobacteria bacterium]
MLAENFVVFDFETTGLQAGINEIIEIGAVKISDGQIVDRFQTLVRPRRTLPLTVQRLTGISDADLAEQSTIAEILPGFLQFIADSPLAAHNAQFDLGFLTASLGRPLNNQCVDTLELARLAFPLAPSLRLSNLERFLSLGGTTFHRALADAEVTARLLLRCLEKIDSWDYGLIRQINAVLDGSGGGVPDLLRRQEKNLLRRFPDRLIKESYLYLAAGENQGLFAKPKTEQQPEPFEPEPVLQALSLDGPFAQYVPNYRYRPGQVEMLAKVTQSLTADRDLVVEAGTGTGKSLAYLVPAASWAAARKEKVVITTHTINLQEQLWNKDIPLVQQLLSKKFAAALVKGRSNYLCLRKWQGLLSETESLDPEGKRELASFITWLSETLTGDRAELNFAAKGQEIWRRLAADSDSCLGGRCRFCNSGCFVMRARQRAEAADVLIVNHSLLLSDVKSDYNVLPEYHYLVIDEAHHLEDAATEHLGNEISDKQLERLLRQLQKNGNAPGLLVSIKNRYLPSMVGRLAQDEIELVQKLLTENEQLLPMIESGAREFFSLLNSLTGGYGQGEGSSQQVRLTAEVASHPQWEALSAAQANLTTRLTGLSERLDKIASQFEDVEEEAVAGLVRDINSVAGQCRDIGCTAAELLDQTVENQVVWIDRDQWCCRLRSAPVEVAPLLRDLLFSRLNSTVLTSATLTVDNSFANFLAGIGLAADTLCIQVQSPFAYEQQALLCIPRDLPEPGRTGENAYTTAVGNLLVDLVRTVKGRTLVLFTSHKMLRDVYFQIKPYLEEEDFQVLGHSLDGSRGRLVEEFKANPRTVLLGASSFWEGVDIQGDALSCVVIVRLPFWPPTIPTIEARLEELAKQNKDGFREFSIPQAVIRLKQGFGRLIRTQEDKGVVVILDNRILDKRYGRKFLNSLPIKTHFRGDSELVLRKVKAWLTAEATGEPLFFAPQK